VVARPPESLSAEERTHWAVVKEKIRTDLKRFLNKQTSRHALIIAVVLQI
jgi:ribonuclease J